MKKSGPDCRFLIRSYLFLLLYFAAEYGFCTDDIALDYPVSDPDAPPRYDEAPAPLLPNFGASRFREYAGDLNMMVLLDSKERSVKQMQVLWYVETWVSPQQCILTTSIICCREQAGLVFERLYPAGDASIIELKLA